MRVVPGGRVYRENVSVKSENDEGNSLRWMDVELGKQ